MCRVFVSRYRLWTRDKWGQQVLTCGLVKGVSSESESDGAPMAGEAAAMEELALGTDALQHVDPLSTEVTLLAVSHRHTSTRLRLRIKSRIRCRTELGGHRRHRRLRGKAESNSVTPHWQKLMKNRDELLQKATQRTLSLSPILVSFFLFSVASFSCRGNKNN